MYWLIPLCLGLNLLLGDVLRMAGIEIKVAYVRNFWLTGLPFFLWGHWFRNRQERGRFAPPGTRRGTILCVLAIGAGAVSSMAEMLLSGGAELYLGSVLMAGGIFVLALTHPQAGAEGFISHVGEKVSLHIYLWQMLVLDVTEGAALFLGIRETAAYAWLMPFFVCAASWMLGEVLSWLGVVIKNRKEKQL